MQDVNKHLACQAPHFSLIHGYQEFDSFIFFFILVILGRALFSFISCSVVHLLFCFSSLDKLQWTH